jgi:hypothetical protein
MTLWEPRIGGSAFEPLYAVSIPPSQSYLVQSSNSDFRDVYVIPDYWVGNTDFYASYKLTPISENS